MTAEEYSEKYTPTIPANTKANATQLLQGEKNIPTRPAVPAINADPTTFTRYGTLAYNRPSG